MASALALTDDGMTVEFDSEDDRPDLTADEAEAVTGRIRLWVNTFPVEDVVLAFRGRVWIALAYDSWAEWCECELGGMKLPTPKRRQVVAGLSAEGMSNVAIGSALNVDEGTVRNDRRVSGSENSEPDRQVLGQDGKTYTPPQPKTDDPEPEPLDAEIVCRDCDGFGCGTCFPADAESAAPMGPEPAVSPLRPRRRPLTDSAREIGLELKSLTARMERLLADDRFARNKDEVAPHLRHYLVEAIKVCQDLDRSINQ